jgi:uncharacterized protein with FMN-binding domain
MSQQAESPGRGQWLKNNLVGIGSAAVLAVYAAGFERTRAAAARFTEEAAGRRSATPIQPTGEIGGLKPRVAEQPATPSAPSESPAQTPKSRAAKPELASTRPAKPEAKSVDTASVVSAVSTEKHTADAPPAVAVAATPTPEPVRDPTPAPARPADTPALPKPAVAPPADTAQPEKIVRKDGTYTGWGTSRHGDIQATVQIQDGKIAFAAISECLTRYSCSWIAALPPQVLARQSADVDVVSGATESTNAFYYAVIEALNKAK